MSVYVPDPALNDWVPLWNLGNNVPAVQPAARVYHSVAQSIPNGTATTLNFDSERFDTDGIHDTVTNNDRLTCRTPGKYVVGAGIHFAGAGGNYRSLVLLVNGTMYAIDRRPPLGGGIGLQSHLNTTVDLRAGDYVQLQYSHDIGSASSVILGGNYSPEFWMALVGGMQGPPGPGTLTYGTTFPANPTDGQEHVLVDSVTNSTYQWRCRYNANSSSPYKWEVIGGNPLVSGPAGSFGQAMAASTWYDLPGGPTLTVPRTGVYILDMRCYHQLGGTPSTFTASAQAIGSSTGSAIAMNVTGSSAWWSGWMVGANGKVLTGGETFKIQVQANAALTTNFASGGLILTPVRIS
jgi:hypothetical protein